ncbi:MAG: hypothetical protein HY236_10980 [Acidobacteria bacterium]|nr:hypothetical protein [Acidobacteriota bacterium]
MPVPLLVSLGFVLAVGTAGYFLYERARHRQPDVPVLTQEAADYLPNLKLSDVEMKAAESFLKQTVTTISGKITNTGPRTVRLAEIHCIFRNPYGQVVLRERVAIVGRRTGPVASGQRRSFLLTFDNIPEGWNQSMPDLVISQIQFQY